MPQTPKSPQPLPKVPPATVNTPKKSDEGTTHPDTFRPDDNTKTSSPAPGEKVQKQ